MRLAKFLAHAGVASRRAAEQLVFAGRVTVGGEVVRDPARYVSTVRDPQGRPTVVSLVPSRERLYPVGRLDADSTGLILLTNDGDLAHRLTHPSFEVPRTYRARVANAPVNEPTIRALREGVELEDGVTAPAKVRRISSNHLEL